MYANELMTCLAERAGIELELGESSACHLECDGLFVSIDHFQELDCFTFTADLGEPPPERLDALYAAMLEGNHLFAGTAGSTLARDSQTGHCTLCRMLPIAQLDGEMFVKAFEQFLNTAETWARIIADFRSAAQIPADDDAGRIAHGAGFQDTSFMQV